MSNPVVITGYGALGATGKTADAIWQALMLGDSGIAPIQQWDVSNWEYNLGAEIKNFNPRQMIDDRKLLKLLSRHDVIGLNAAQQAVDHSSLLTYRQTLNENETIEFNDRTGVYVASPGIRYSQQHELLPLFKESQGDLRKFGEKLFDLVHPMWLLRILSNNVLAYVGIKNGFKGPNQNIPNHGVSGTQAIAEAYYAIKNQQIERAIIVGYESAVQQQEQMYYGRIGTLSKTGLRPFNIDHDGTILAEAGAAIIVESLEAAQRRNATIYGEILSGAFTSEAKGVFSIRDDGDGTLNVLQVALSKADLSPSDVGMVCAHANANPLSDISEATAIANCFGKKTVPVTGYKWSVGHSLAAAGVLETILTCKALQENKVPGIATFTIPNKDCETINVSSDHQLPRSNIAACLTRGFGSLNGCLIIRNCK